MTYTRNATLDRWIWAGAVAATFIVMLSMVFTTYSYNRMCVEVGGDIHDYGCHVLTQQERNPT